MSNRDLSDDKERYANIARELHKHEDNLLHMRFTWLSNLQGLLFAALGFTWKEHVWYIVLVICLMGIIVSVSFMAIVITGRAAQKNIADWEENSLNQFGQYKGPPLKGYQYPKKPTKAQWLRRRLSPWRLMPWVFIVAWSAILAFMIFYKWGSKTNEVEMNSSSKFSKGVNE